MYISANILTATNPMHAVPCHHGREVSAYIGSAAVAIFVDDIIISLKIMTTR